MLFALAATAGPCQRAARGRRRYVWRVMEHLGPSARGSSRSAFLIHSVPNKDDAFSGPLGKARGPRHEAVLGLLFAQRGFCFPGFGKRTNIDMLNHNCSAWEGKHSRLGCKIVALLACGIVLEASQFPSLVPGTGRALGRVGFLIPPTTTTTTVSTAFTA